MKKNTKKPAPPAGMWEKRISPDPEKPGMFAVYCGYRVRGKLERVINVFKLTEQQAKDFDPPKNWHKPIPTVAIDTNRGI